ncbi:helix-turn-helix domain-containing protein [Streptobacillus canis]|uniref:helix-turn-helix domain-containing protein n=1 Tax=Streptobacillus canis TaxID=2678686 RepID=UPI0012E21437|nr:helix-turn-helix transcriptional regulator [Streptobacillus canis]
MKDIGEKLRELRKSQKITMKELADMIGTTEANISRYETGKIKNIPMKQLQKLSKSLNVPLFLLIEPTKEIESNTKKWNYQLQDLVTSFKVRTSQAKFYDFKIDEDANFKLEIITIIEENMKHLNNIEKRKLFTLILKMLVNLNVDNLEKANDFIEFLDSKSNNNSK